MVFYQNILLAVLVGAAAQLAAQIPLTEQQAIELALKNHPAMEATSQHIRQQEVLINAGAMWEHSQLFHNITADPDLGMFGTTTVGVQQNFPSGKMTRANRDLHASRQAQAVARQGLTRQDIIRQVREIYHHLSYLDGKAALFNRLDSVYQRVATAADVSYRAGDVSLAEKLAAQDKAAQIRLDARTGYPERTGAARRGAAARGRVFTGGYVAAAQFGAGEIRPKCRRSGPLGAGTGQGAFFTDGLGGRVRAVPRQRRCISRLAVGAECTAVPQVAAGAVGSGAGGHCCCQCGIPPDAAAPANGTRPPAARAGEVPDFTGILHCGRPGAGCRTIAHGRTELRSG